MIAYTERKQTLQRKQTYDYKSRKGKGKDKFGIWDYQILNTICKIDREKDLFVFSTYYPISCNNL